VPSQLPEWIPALEKAPEPYRLYKEEETSEPEAVRIAQPRSFQFGHAKAIYLSLHIKNVQVWLVRPVKPIDLYFLPAKLLCL